MLVLRLCHPLSALRSCGTFRRIPKQVLLRNYIRTVLAALRDDDASSPSSRTANMASIFPTVFWLAVVLGLLAVVWFFTPKGPQQMYAKTSCNMLGNELTGFTTRVIKTALMLTLTCCYLMWMVTYMAQLHPLIGTPLSNLNC